ncbi:MAG: HYR domain-containing protein, partial [Paludibacteraceae bacterium]|nr:HYR domain-containing protein [Paludibacteraceae bacterium]
VIALTDATDKVSGSFPIGTTKITWTATDGSGNLSSCPQTVKVEDKTAPKLVCGGDVSKDADADKLCMATQVSVTLPKVTENCSKPYTLTATRSDGVAMNLQNGAAVYVGDFYVGTTTITWTATDAAGNVSESCTQNVVVTDNVARNLDLTHNICDLSKYADADAIAEIERNYQDYDVVKLSSSVNGVYGFTLAHKKATGDIATCRYSGILTVSASRPDALLDLTHTVCDLNSFGDADAEAFIKSKTGNVYDVEKVTASGNSKVFSYTLKATQGDCVYDGGKLTVGQYDKPFAPKLKVDNFCEGLTGKLTHEGTLPDTFGTDKNKIVWIDGYPDLTETAEAKDHNYSYKYIDNNGCSVDSVLKYTVHSKPVAPELKVADFCFGSTGELTYEAGIDKDKVKWTPSYPDLTATAEAKPYTYSYTYTDGNSCESESADLTYTVHANPQISAVVKQGGNVIPDGAKICRSKSGDLVIEVKESNFSSGLSYKFGSEPASNDNTKKYSYDCATADFSTVVTVVHTANNTACSTSVKVNVSFEELPTLTCAAGEASEYYLPSDACEVDVPFKAPFYTGCNSSVTFSFALQKMIDGSYADVIVPAQDWNTTSYKLAPGSYKTIFTVNDNCLDVKSCERTFEVKDEIAPDFTCPEPISVSTDEGKCGADIDLAVPVVTDNCDGAWIEASLPNGTVKVSGDVVRESFSVGATDVKWTAYDAAGNSKSCVQKVTVTDNEEPVVNCVKDIAQYMVNDACGWSGDISLPEVTDNCGVSNLSATRSDNVPVTIDMVNKTVSTGRFPLNETVITWTATDANGNTGTCKQTIEVLDNVPPTITCENDKYVFADNSCKWNGALTLPSANDNCSDYTLKAEYSTDDDNYDALTSTDKVSFQIGTTFVRWTVTDKANNVASCSLKVVVKDNIPPTIACGANIETPATEMCRATKVSVPLPTVTENCSKPYTLTATRSDGVAMNLQNGTTVYEGDFYVGTTTITWTATDEAGNKSEVCEQKVTVTDGEFDVNMSLNICDLAKYTVSMAINAISKKYPDYNVKMGDVTESNQVRDYPFTLTHKNASGTIATCEYSGTLKVSASKPETLLALNHQVCDLNAFDADSAKTYIESVAGVYAVTVTSGNSGVFNYTLSQGDCSYEGKLTVTEFVKPTLPVVNNMEFCENASNKPALPVSFADFNSISWKTNHGALDKLAAAATPYEYVFTVTDENGCESGKVKFTVTVNAAPEKLKETSYSYCPEVQLDANSLKADVLNKNTLGTDETLTVSGADDKYTYTKTNGKGCKVSGALTINRYAKPTAPEVKEMKFCENLANANKPVLPTDTMVGDVTYTYEWSPQTPLSSLSAGNREYSYKAKESEHGCVSDSKSLTVTVNAAPAYLSKLAYTYCPGLNVDSALNVDVPAAYEAQLGASYNNEKVTVAEKYTYTISNASGCSVSGSLNVSVFPEAVAPNLTVANFCEGSTGKYSMNISGLNIAWKDNVQPNLSETAKAGPHSYNYTYTDNNGCSVNSKVEYEVYALPTAPYVKDMAFCENLEASAKPQLPVSNSGVFVGFGINWETNHGALNTLGAGEYTYTFSVTDNNKCESADSSFVVNVHKTPDVPVFSVADFCEGTAGKLVEDPNVPSTSDKLTWSPSYPKLTDLTEGQYKYSYTYTDDNSCSVSGSFTFNVKAKPVLPKLTVENFCEGVGGELKGLPDAGNINWSNEPNYGTNAAAGNHSYGYSYTYTNGCKVEGGMLKYTVYPKPADPKLVVKDFCEGTTGELLNKPTDGKIVWTDDKAPDLSGTVAKDYSYTYKHVVSYDDGKNNCESAVGTLAYKVHALPQLSATVMQGGAVVDASNKACPSKGEIVDINVSVDNNIADATFEYVWSDDNTITTSSRSVALKCGDADKTYTVTVSSVVANAPTCSQDWTINVPVMPAPTLTCRNGLASYAMPDDKSTASVTFTPPVLNNSCANAGGSFALYKTENGKDNEKLVASDEWAAFSKDLGLGTYRAVYKSGDICAKDSCGWSFSVTDSEFPKIECPNTLSFEIASGDLCTYELKDNDAKLVLPEVSDNGGNLTLYGVLNGSNDKIVVDVVNKTWTGSMTFK